MKQKIFTIYDNKAGVHYTPWFTANQNTAERTFKDLREDSTTLIGKNPKDFVLKCVGIFDDQVGKIEVKV